MNTTTNTRGVSEAMVDAWRGRAAELVDSGASVEERAYNNGKAAAMHDCASKLHAALSAQPSVTGSVSPQMAQADSASPSLSAQQGQGEEGFDARKYVRHMADVLEAGGDLLNVDADLLRLATAINKAANTAPPAQPAGQEPIARIDFTSQPVRLVWFRLLPGRARQIDVYEHAAQRVPEITREMWEAGRDAYAMWITEVYQKRSPEGPTEEDRQEGYERAKAAMLAASPVQPAERVPDEGLKDLARNWRQIAAPTCMRGIDAPNYDKGAMNAYIHCARDVEALLTASPAPSEGGKGVEG